MSSDSAQNDIDAEAISKLRRKRVIVRFAASVAMVIGIASGAVAWVLVTGDTTTSPPPEYEPAAEDDLNSPVVTSATAPEISSGPTLVLGLDRRTGQISGDLLMPDTDSASSDYLDRDYRTALAAANDERGGESVPAGSCGYTDACPQGLPMRFEDDLGIAWAANEIGRLPRDGAEWHQSRIGCYVSSRLIEDCNFELAVGGYGELEYAGFDPACLSDQFARRMESTLSPVPAAWWGCESEWWSPNLAHAGIHAACAQAFRPIAAPVPVPQTPAAADGTEGADVNTAEAQEIQSPPASSGDEIERCVAAGTGSDPADSETTMAPCEVAQAVLTVVAPTAAAAVPPCGIAVLTPVDTWSLRTTPPATG